MTTSSSPMNQAPQSAAAPEVTPRVTHATDKGGVRDNNEDFYSFVPFSNLPLDRRPTSADYERKGLMYVVADGMGGAVAGEVASRMAVRAVVEGYYADVDGNVPTSLLRALRDANVAVYRHSLTSPTLQGMGTTLTALVLHDGFAYCGHVGDTRLYRLRDGQLERISKDHTMVQGLVDKGVINLEQARLHPQRNEIRRAVGTQPDVDIDVDRTDLRMNDLFLLSSDGLHDE
ncbi:MAG TPA: protein phosphatase 2C domain-containing protein, partial [Anaerolineae bacterium]|nr:protein phosphatase 2C domain-containing protein [Anaerolineae bacterium]